MQIIHSIQDKVKLILLDTVILALMPVLALIIRFEGTAPVKELLTLKEWLPLAVVVSLGIFYAYGMYHRIWHYARLRDMVAIIGAVTLSVGIVFLLFLFLGVEIPRSIYILSWMLDIGAVGISRLAYKVNLDMVTERHGERKQVLIIGAGDAGAMLVREIEQNNAATMTIIGFLDDDLKKVGSRLSGFPILGCVDDISRVTRENHVDEIIVAIPSAEGTIVRRIADSCRLTGCEVKIMPGLYDMVDQRVSTKNLRDIRIEDLLRRDPIQMDFDRITKYISGKTILITGAGGSIGSEIFKEC